MTKKEQENYWYDILEHGSSYDFSQHPRFVNHRNYGSVNFSFFQ